MVDKEEGVVLSLINDGDIVLIDNADICLTDSLFNKVLKKAKMIVICIHDIYNLVSLNYIEFSEYSVKIDKGCVRLEKWN